MIYRHYCLIIALLGVVGFSSFNIVHADSFVTSDNGLGPYTVQLVAHVQESPPQITLEWPSDTGATNYIITRDGSAVATVSSSTLSYTDTNVVLGIRYQYTVEKEGTGSNFIFDQEGHQYPGAVGYVYSGIDIPLVQSRGKNILI